MVVAWCGAAALAWGPGAPALAAICALAGVVVLIDEVGRAIRGDGVLVAFDLGDINRLLRFLRLQLVIEVWDGEGEQAPTRLIIMTRDARGPQA